MGFKDKLKEKIKETVAEKVGDKLSDLTGSKTLGKLVSKGIAKTKLEKKENEKEKTEDVKADSSKKEIEFKPKIKKKKKPKKKRKSKGFLSVADPRKQTVRAVGGGLLAVITVVAITYALWGIITDKSILYAGFMIDTLSMGKMFNSFLGVWALSYTITRNFGRCIFRACSEAI
ncbi:MAG: hypothetical protein ACTSPD_13060 [Promethearchaeota archaeon]